MQHCSGNTKKEHGGRVCVVCSAGDQVVQNKVGKNPKLAEKNASILL